MRGLSLFVNLLSGLNSMKFILKAGGIVIKKGTLGYYRYFSMLTGEIGGSRKARMIRIPWHLMPLAAC
jgi:hypothetical protein